MSTPLIKLRQKTDKTGEVKALRTATKNRIRTDTSLGEKVVITAIYAFVGVFAIAAIFPFWLVLIGSFAPEKILSSGYRILYPEYTLEAYRLALQTGLVALAYKNTLIVTLTGVFLALVVCLPYAYVLSREKSRLTTALLIITVVPMVFGTSLVGQYLTVRSILHLTDTYAAVILPMLFSPFNIFLMVAYFRTLPMELFDAAKIDGANELTIFREIALPLSTPIIATVGLFFTLSYWNDWWLPMLYLDNPKMHTLQLMLQQLLFKSTPSQYLPLAFAQVQLPTTAVRLVTVILAIGPIILVYPFVQRYFIKGITLGAVKG